MLGVGTVERARTARRSSWVPMLVEARLRPAPGVLDEVCHAEAVESPGPRAAGDHSLYRGPPVDHALEFELDVLKDFEPSFRGDEEIVSVEGESQGCDDGGVFAQSRLGSSRGRRGRRCRRRCSARLRSRRRIGRRLRLVVDDPDAVIDPFPDEVALDVLS